MDSRIPMIELRLCTSQPIELEHFVTAFTALGNQYERFMKERYPDLATDSQVFVKNVREGSIEVDLLSWAATCLPAMITFMDQVLIVEEFLRTYGRRLRIYLFGADQSEKDVNRDDTATSGDLKDLLGQVSAVARDPNASLSLATLIHEDGKRQTKTFVQFSTHEARNAVESIYTHQKLLEVRPQTEHSKVLMIFSQSNINEAKIGKRTGERVTISSITQRSLPLYYASDIAPQRIKHEIRDGEDNIYKKGFIVDVTAELHEDKIIAYRVTNVHEVIDLID